MKSLYKVIRKFHNNDFLGVFNDLKYNIVVKVKMSRVSALFFSWLINKL